MLAQLLLLLLGGLHAARADEGADFLPPEQAFQLRTEVLDAQHVRLAWTIAPGYHLYRERLNFAVLPTTAVLLAPVLPGGEREFDSNFNRDMEVYRSKLMVDLPLPAKAGVPFTLQVGYQGCADKGLCYPPALVTYRVDPAAPGVLAQLGDVPALPASTQAATPASGQMPAASPAAGLSAGAPSATSSDAAPQDDASLAQRTLQSGSAWRIGGAFLAFGLLLSFTPCVLPMVPILSSIIVGEGAVSRGRGFSLALAYCAGMALVYTALGVAAGLAGEGLAGALQKPWVLLTFSALLIALSLSMFDLYQLQLPSALQSRLSQASGSMGGGRFLGVFVMGALSALIVGPCVAGPLAGALLYISQTRNVWTGGWALFSMAAGMSVPLLLTGISAGSLLPRVGAWMNGVKRLFGVLLLAVAVWMAGPVLPAPLTMALWALLALLCAVLLRVLEPLPSGAAIGAYAGKTLGLAMLAVGLLELAGAAGAGSDMLRPLGHLSAARGVDSADKAEVRFSRIRSVAELDQVLASSTTPVMLDFYADWCVSCKEMERFTFSQPAVSARLQQVRLLQADVTANSDEDKALMKRFGLFGPPGIILFNAAGKEIPRGRVIGFLAPEPFVQHLARLL